LFVIRWTPNSRETILIKDRYEDGSQRKLQNRQCALLLSIIIRVDYLINYVLPVIG